METSWTLSDLQRVERAISTGARRVKFEDREVEYSSLSELIRARETIARALGMGNSLASQRTRGEYDKGL